MPTTETPTVTYCTEQLTTPHNVSAKW